MNGSFRDESGTIGRGVPAMKRVVICRYLQKAGGRADNQLRVGLGPHRAGRHRGRASIDFQDRPVTVRSFIASLFTSWKPCVSVRVIASNKPFTAWVPHEADFSRRHGPDSAGRRHRRVRELPLIS